MKFATGIAIHTYTRRCTATIRHTCSAQNQSVWQVIRNRCVLLTYVLWSRTQSTHIH